MSGAKKPPPEVTEYFRKIGKKYGASGGRASADNMTPAQRKNRAKKASDAATASLTPAQRSARAKKAAEAMWKKRRKADE